MIDPAGPPLAACVRQLSAQVDGTTRRQVGETLPTRRRPRTKLSIEEAIRAGADVDARVAGLPERASGAVVDAALADRTFAQARPLTPRISGRRPRASAVSGPRDFQFRWSDNSVASNAPGGAFAERIG